MRSSLLFSVLSVSIALAACSSPPEAKYGHKPDDGVPANSASETRLAVGEKNTSPAAASAAPPAADPTQAFTMPFGAGSPGAPPPADPPESAPGKGGKPGKPGPAGKDGKDGKDSKERVTKAECSQTLDKYMDLALGTDTRLEGVPPEMIPQLKQQVLSQAKGQKGDPCATEVVTRGQYNCAMAATSTAAWQRCMGK
ncbi:MAG: hypothetical protein KF819_21310 [Labilithrix sp.]|nr:hypothetical protein [Labilithrix sp.]